MHDNRARSNESDRSETALDLRGLTLPPRDAGTPLKLPRRYRTNEIESEAKKLHEQSVVIDLHAHPGLMTYLFNRNFQKSYRAPGFLSPLTLRNNLPSLHAGGVNILVAATHTPEPALWRDCLPIRAAGKVWPKLKRSFCDPADKVAFQMLDNFEQAVKRTDANAAIAHSPFELRDIVKSGRLAIIHSLEGAHSLAGKLENVDEFHKRGMASITLGHFYANELVSTVEGVPDTFLLRRLGSLPKRADLTKGLTPFGHDAVERMFELGIVVDLTHSTPIARSEIFTQNNNRRPLIFSHVGAAALTDAPMNPTDAEIRMVAESGGLVGVVALNQWLIGKDEGPALDNMVRTIKHVVKIGGADAVGISSDSDGLTTPPSDYREPADLPKLTEKLLREFPAPVVEKILGRNFLRVLQDGWGR